MFSTATPEEPKKFTDAEKKRLYPKLAKVMNYLVRRIAERENLVCNGTKADSENKGIPQPGKPS